jgi:hypothetical protein
MIVVIKIKTMAMNYKSFNVCQRAKNNLNSATYNSSDPKLFTTILLHMYMLHAHVHDFMKRRLSYGYNSTINVIALYGGS